MEDKLTVLISYYEEEKHALEKLIQDYILEEEYQLAHFHQKALHQLNHKLYTFKYFTDNLFEEKRLTQNAIKNLEKKLEAESEWYLKEHLNGLLLKQREELLKFDEIPKKETAGSDTVINETLINLLEKRIKSFRLIFKNTDSLFLNFRYERKVLKVAMPHVQSHFRKEILDAYSLNSLERLGFRLTKNGAKLVFILPGHKEEIINKMKIVLSKIVFEVFHFTRFKNDSFIEIYGKGSRGNVGL